MHKFRTLLLGLAVLLALPCVAFATPPFFKKFEDLYGKAIPGKCNICHLEGKKKSINNEYGEALKNAGLNKALTKPPLKDAPGTDQAIQDAFDKAYKEKSSQGDTYGERIKTGKLPAP